MNAKKVNKPVSVAIFQYDLGVGGVQRSLINMLNNIDFTKYTIDLYIVDTNNFYEIDIPSEVTIIEMKPLPSFSKVLPFDLVKLLFKKNIHKYLKGKYYDAAIDFNGYQHITALGASEVRSGRYYMWIHDDNMDRLKIDPAFRLSWFLQRAKYKLFHKAIAVSSGLEESITKTTPFKKSTIFVVNNFIDTKSIITKSKENITALVDTSKYNLISVSRLVYQKGVDILLETFKEAVSINPRIKLHIVGDGQERDKLERLSVKLGLADKVVFYGAQSNPYSYMAKMDGLISTSRHEGQGMNMLEAKCLGLEVFIPKHLEKYTYNIKASKNIAFAISVATPNRHKTVDNLTEYNQNVLHSINQVFTGSI